MMPSEDERLIKHQFITIEGTKYVKNNYRLR